MAVDLNNGLLAAWNFNSNGLDSQGSNDLTPVGVTFDTVNQHLGSACADFDGNDYFTGGAIFPFSSTDSFSFAKWVNVTDRTQFMPIISRRNDSGHNGYIFSIGGFSGVGEILVGYQKDISNRLLRRSGGIISNNTWMLVGGSYDGSKTIGGMHTYISGVLDDGATIANGTITDADYTGIDFEVGKDLGVFFYEDLADTLAVWGRVLNADEWLALDNGGAGIELPVPSAAGNTNLLLMNAG